MTNDPLAGVMALDGVATSATHARDSIDVLLRQNTMRRNAPSFVRRVAAESALRGARASAALAGVTNDDIDHPLMQGALRVTAATRELAATWAHAPRQALARLHVLAAGDLANHGTLGRPRADVDETRLDQLLRLDNEADAPGVVVAAVVHAELMSLRAFDAANGVVARGAERMILIASGVDQAAVSVPEVGHWAQAAAYDVLLEGFQTGRASGVGAWVRHCSAAYARGAEEGFVIVTDLRDGAG